jgi:hypothetical protein
MVTCQAGWEGLVRPPQRDRSTHEEGRRVVEGRRADPVSMPSGAVTTRAVSARPGRRASNDGAPTRAASDRATVAISAVASWARSHGIDVSDRAIRPRPNDGRSTADRAGRWITGISPSSSSSFRFSARRTPRIPCAPVNVRAGHRAPSFRLGPTTRRSTRQRGEPRHLRTRVPT